MHYATTVTSFTLLLPLQLSANNLNNCFTCNSCTNNTMWLSCRAIEQLSDTQTPAPTTQHQYILRRNFGCDQFSTERRNDHDLFYIMSISGILWSILVYSSFAVYLYTMQLPFSAAVNIQWHCHCFSAGWTSRSIMPVNRNWNHKTESEKAWIKLNSKFGWQTKMETFWLESSQSTKIIAVRF